MSIRLAHLLRLLNRTSPPASPVSGDVWWRSDLSQMRGSDGLAGESITLGPEGNLPVVRATTWHTVGAPFGPAGTTSVPASRMFALPFWPGRSCTLTAMAANVTLAVAGGNLRMGIYNSDGTLPTTLLTDFGTVTVGVTGIRSITGLSTSVRPVLHYLVVGRQGGAINLGLTARDSWDPIISETTPTITGNLNAYYQDGIAGALPGTFGTPAGSIQGPAVSVQLT